MTNMEIYKGDNKTWVITVKDSDGNTVDITGAELEFTVKESDTDTTAKISRKNAAAGGDATQIEMSDPSNGEFKIHLVPANTSNLDSGSYVYDIEMTLDEKVTTLIKDSFSIIQDVTFTVA